MEAVAFQYIRTVQCKHFRDPAPTWSASMPKSRGMGWGWGLQTPRGGPAGRPGPHGFCLQAWLAEVEGRLPARGDQARRQSGMYDGQTAPAVNNCAQDRERYSI